MEKLLTILMMTICLVSFGQQEDVKKTINRSDSIARIDSSLFAVFPYYKDQYSMFKNCKQGSLTINDHAIIENVLIKCLKEFNDKQQILFQEKSRKNPELHFEKKYYVIDLKNYRRQYIVVTNTKGEKEVWVNCFCNISNNTWRTRILIVMDGGNCYFNLKINLTKQSFYDLMVNGEA